jgi:hypothetical protein
MVVTFVLLCVQIPKDTFCESSSFFGVRFYKLFKQYKCFFWCFMLDIM